MEDIHWTLAILREVLSTTSVACTHGNFASGKTLILMAMPGHDAPFLYSMGSITRNGGKGDDQDDPKYARVNLVIALHTQPFETLK